MRTRFGTTLGLVAVFMALAIGQPDASAQTCADVTVRVGTLLGGEQNEADVPQFISPGTTVSFFPVVNLNLGGAQARVVSASWWFSTTPLQADEDGNFPPPDIIRQINPDLPITSAQNVVNFTYPETGAYDVGLRVTIENDQGQRYTCPQAANTPSVRPEFITVAEEPTADLSAEILVYDQAAVVPTNDWVPLFSINMSYNEDNPAPRVLSRLRFQMFADPDETNDDTYFMLGSNPLHNHFYEFAVFQDFGGDDGGGDGQLDFSEDGCIYQTFDENNQPISLFVSAHPYISWDAQGYPYELTQDAQGNRNLNDAIYDLSFLFDSRAAGYEFPGTDPTDPDGNLNPQFSPDNWLTAAPSPGNSYIVAVRTSSSFPTGQTFSVGIGEAEMRPVTETGEVSAPVPGDSYPEFPVAEDVGYSSSFDVFDIRGGALRDDLLRNNWNWPNYTYTPLPEFTRPRWDTNVIDFVFGEQLDIRNIFAVEAWTPLLGISAHGFTNGSGGPAQGAEIRELNMVLTDVGADPYGTPGNGGLNPNTGLETLTSQTFPDDDNFAAATDYSFNGLWVFHDTNNDGVFQPPTPSGGTGPGVTFTDFPLVPSNRAELTGGFVIPGLLQWSYVPFPPGGGDPWWKIRLGFQGGRRRPAPDVTPSGYMEIVPDSFPLSESLTRADYFVVARADSGFADVSGLTGDGTGIALGAETRFFVEPRRWNPSLDSRGRWDGGILLSQQFINPENYIISDTVDLDPNNPGERLDAFAWQEDPRWDIVCTTVSPRNTPDYSCPTAPTSNVVYPWWNERSSNRDTSKPVKVGADVHDLVLTYSTNNLYAKETFINVGQTLTTFTFDAENQTLFSLFMDPPIFSNNEGILSSRFINFDKPGIVGDVRFGTDDLLTLIQYSYETVPFKLTDDAIDAQLDDPRSFFFPNPQEQPTLPRLETWPPGNPLIVIDSGLESYVYLADENTPNEEFFDPSSSNSQETYRDDEYVAVLVDGGAFSNDQLVDAFLVDENGAKFRITGNQGNRLTLAQGHAAYLDREYQFINDELVLPDYPFGVPVGEASAIRRGNWMVVQDALPRGVYPRQSDWPEGLLEPLQDGLRAARLLKQHITPESVPTAMLGVNLVGTDDPVVNSRGPITLSSLTVAFWGPEFDPNDLQPLDPDGELFTAGVVLYEDSSGDGVYSGGLGSAADQIVPVEEGTLRWRSAPEAIDIDGDYIADDMSGDGVVFLGDESALSVEDFAAWDGLDDRAWVLRLQPRELWTVPQSDERAGEPSGTTKSGVSAPAMVNGSVVQPKSGGSAVSSEDVFSVPLPALEGDGPKYVQDKALAAGGNPGTDLFVVVRTSETIGAFERFRAVVPSRLPERTPDSEQFGGIEMLPPAYSVADSYTKKSPDEGAVQDFYGHDMIEVSVGARIDPITDGLLVNGIPVVEPGSPAAAMMGIDISVNRPEHLAASGDSGTVDGPNTFTTGGTIESNPGNPYFENNAWTSEAVGLYLMAMSQGTELESRLEAYEITAVNGLSLTLRAGVPRNGSSWAVVRDPSFLEQVVVEFYDQDNDGRFNLQSDLLPLDFEDPANDQMSGVALYRDNDFHPSNTNGVYDPPITDEDGNVIEYIDLPIRLDDPPTLIGTVGGEPPNQVKFVFSSPGTDNLTGRDVVTYENQPRLRQWVPQTFGGGSNDPDFGSDIFVVVRTSRTMALGDDFFLGLSSWGPDTPSEPDPDNFSATTTGGQSGQNPDEFDIFSEFPWGSRALGFITFFRDPPAVRYWTQDRDTGKDIVRSEVDHSQDASPVRYWVRSNPKTFGRTLPITALAPPSVDFSSDRIRQVPGPYCSQLSDPPEDCGEIQFTLEATGSVASVLWEFGDGTTSTELNPVKTYEDIGIYTVKVTVTDGNGIRDFEEKANYIQIMNAPLADFSASPVDAAITPKQDGDDGLDVSFIDLSIGTDDLIPVAYFWNFGDGTTTTVTERPTAEEPLVHRYTVAGFYTVTLEVTFLNGANQQTQTVQCRRTNLVNVRPCNAGCAGLGEGEGEGETEGDGAEDPPAADFTIQSLVKDREALVPLNDWVPLFEFTMGYPADTPAERVLRSLTYDLKIDGRDPEDLNYANISGPEQSDILEFAIFEQTFDDSDEDNTLNFENDFMLPIAWDNSGAPLGTLTEIGGRLRYTLDFIGDGTPLDPDYPLVTGPVDDEGFAGKSYIVAVRTSATWRSQITMAYEVINADMVIPSTGVYPRNDEGESVDSYSTDFNGGETFDEEDAYSASFGAYDMTAGFGSSNSDSVSYSPFNFWNQPEYFYAPFAEHVRPAWNLPDRVLSFNGAVLLELQELVPMETFWPVVGLNLHSTQGEHFDGFADRVIGSSENASMLELNLVLTDIGADPFGPPGNGGFNAPEGLENIVPTRTGIFEPAIGEDYAYNGAWVWYDTNGNGQFDPPVAAELGGITFVDRPMTPLVDKSLMDEWEWVPLPPGGGDPWWKISLRFQGYQRTEQSEDEVFGWVEKQPDNHYSDLSFSASEVSFDYFVVVRTDSGFIDVSRRAGDGSGIAPGADFRAFIEPRRFDASNGLESGGIYVDSMIPPLTPVLTQFNTLQTRWQEDPQFTDLQPPLPSRWGEIEPWWPQRTLNENNAKPVKSGVQVHDLSLTYFSNSSYARYSDISFGGGPDAVGICYTYASGFGEPTDFDRWADPLGIEQEKFFNRHSVGVTRFRTNFTAFFQLPIGDPVPVIVQESLRTAGFAYETVPFFLESSVNGDLPPQGPRSIALAEPPLQPTLPDYLTWPMQSEPTDLQRASDWADEDEKARVLTQKDDINSDHVALLGINTVGANDPLVNASNEQTIAKIVVAFWGPDFTPNDLLDLDPDGRDLDSGVLLWEDADRNGTFSESSFLDPFLDAPILLPTLDQVVPLENLRWSNAAEPIDVDGDGVADDMNGDGLVDERDNAWIVELVPEDLWVVPHTDNAGTIFSFDLGGLCGTYSGGNLLSGSTPVEYPKRADAKALDPLLNQPGDDLFITIRTSERPKRFEKIRALIPATLPTRGSTTTRRAGIQFFPQINSTSPGGFLKSSPEEDAVQDFYGHDNLEINVPVKLTSPVNSNALITIGGPAMAALGIDASTNMGTANGTRVTGVGVGGESSFVVEGAMWAVDAYAGDFLIDNRFESYRILSNTGNRLDLESGIPRDGNFRIVQNPTFLEEVTVEFYNEGTDADFNPATDLLPLDIDQEVSGVALYRDNDEHPDNRNGVYDPFIDIPLALDVEPQFIGQVGEDTQVHFTFSSPGTDDYPLPIELQSRNRQWIYDTFGSSGSDPASGADFFVVVRASNDMRPDDNFRVGIVNFGPNTPTEPDPDTFVKPIPNGQGGFFDAPINDYVKFREFPWADRGTGFITFLKEPQYRYYMDGARAGRKQDNSGFEWIRSHGTKERRSGTFTARTRPVNSFSVVIDSSSEDVVPAIMMADESFDLILRGSGFGTRPQVVITGYEVTVNSNTATAIDISLSTPDGVAAQDPIVVIVRNPDTGEEASRTGLLRTGDVGPDTPVINSISPSKTDENGFPVTITGTDLPSREAALVVFGNTQMPVLSASANGTSITVGYPAGGFPNVGLMDVRVRTRDLPEDTGPEDIKVNAFEFVASSPAPKIGFFGCAPSSASTSMGGNGGDIAMVALMILMLVAATLRRHLSGKALQRIALRVGAAAIVVLGAIAFALPASAFFPIGGFDANQILWLARWPVGTMDLNNNGTIEADEGVEIILEVGPSGFTAAEDQIVMESLQVWEDIATSYVGFKIRGRTQDYILSGIEPDTIQTISMQVTGVPNIDEDIVPDPADVIIGDLGGGVLGVTLILFTVEGGLLPTPEGGVFVPQGTIIDSDIVISDTAVRPLTPGAKPLADLRSVMVHEVGHFIGLAHPPLNNLTPEPSDPSDLLFFNLVEDPILPLTTSSGVQQMVGVTPTMFPIVFDTRGENSGVREPGGATLAPDDISGASWLYPRGSQSNFFNLNHEARSETRPASGLPSIGLPGAHIVAWADHDNDPNSARVPMFSTMAALYEPTANAGLQGLFDLVYLWKRFELANAQPAAFFTTSYTFTSNPLNGSGFARQAPTIAGPDVFDSLQGATSFSVDTRGDGDYTNDFPSEVFEEVENIIDVSNKDAGTPMIWSFTANTLVSMDTGRTLPTILPNNRPMFGDANDVCPLNLVQADGGGGTTTPDAGTTGATLAARGADKVRGFRDGLLLQSAIGTAVVDLYYSVAPAITAYLKGNAWAFAGFRAVVLSIYWVLDNLVLTGLAAFALFATLFAARRRVARKAIARLFVLTLIVCATANRADAAMAFLSDTELAANSDAVITGTVLSTEGRWALGGRIYTDVVLEVEDTVKGNINKATQFTFSVIGGRVGAFEMYASEMPSFDAGEEVVLFLRELSNGEYVVYSGEQGRVSISSSKGEKNVYRSDASLSTPSEDGKSIIICDVGHDHHKAEGSESDAETETEDAASGQPLDAYLDFLRDIVRKQKQAERK